MLQTIEKVLSNGYKVVTETRKNAFGCKNLTQTFTEVFSPEGKLVISRSKGLFKNHSSGATYMHLPDGLNGTLIQKSTKIYTPQILPVEAPVQNYVTLDNHVFRPDGGSGLSILKQNVIDKNGKCLLGKLMYDEPTSTRINPDKHFDAQELIKKVFG